MPDEQAPILYQGQDIAAMPKEALQTLFRTLQQLDAFDPEKARLMGPVCRILDRMGR